MIRTIFTNEQKQVIDYFHRVYFSHKIKDKESSRISLSSFLSMTKNQQRIFIKSWVTDQRLKELDIIEQNLQKQLQKIQQLKQLYNKALTSWK